MNELALFAGTGGGILGGLLHGWRTVAAVEIEDYPRRVLLQRQADGILPRFPIWDDVRTFDGRPWRGKVDIITGGFPCQDISAAGKGAGLEGKRSGLWAEMARIIGEVMPKYVFVENSPMLTGRGLERVLLDLATLGYDAEWGVLGACDTGAPHKRERIWIVANTVCYGARERLEETSRETRQTSTRAGRRMRSESGNGCAKLSDADSVNGRKGRSWGLTPDGPRERKSNKAISNTNQAGRYGGSGTGQELPGRGEFENESWWAIEPAVGRVAHGVAHRVDRLKALGNGQVPAVAALAWEVLSGSKPPNNA